MKNKKSNLHTAYQRHIDVIKLIGLILLVFAVLSAIIIAKLLADDQYTENLYVYFVIAFICFVLGITVSVIASIKQNKADVINERLYAVWRYKPETIYAFYRKQCRYKKKTAFIDFTVTALIVAVIGLIMFFNAVSHYLGIVFLVAALLIFICGIFTLPYMQYLMLKLRTKIFGDAKEIIFSRGGIWYCGKICYFGDNGITYHRVERKDMHGQDAIVFYYTRTRGFQQTAMELAIPVAPKMAYAADELVEEFNRSDLLDYKRGNIFKKKRDTE